MRRFRIPAGQLVDPREASVAGRDAHRDRTEYPPEFNVLGDRIVWDRIVPVPEYCLVSGLVG